MYIIISNFSGWVFIVAAVFGWTFFFAFVVWRIHAMSKEYLAMERQREDDEKRKTVSENPLVLLTPKERREYMLNHIEDGRFYAISSLRNHETTLVCAKRYDAEAERLYCYAYLWIIGNGNYNLHVIDPRDTSQSCKFLGNQSLRIDFNITPCRVVFEEENISPYIEYRDYYAFVHSLQAAGFDWKIERSEENILGSYKYRLKETITK